MKGEGMEEKVEISVPKPSTKNILCEDGNDLLFLLLGFGKAIDTGLLNGAGAEIITTSVKIILAEYLACVASGKIQPYLFDNSVEDSGLTNLFRKFIVESKMMAMRSDVPMKEENGKLKVDFDQLEKEVGDGYRSITH